MTKDEVGFQLMMTYMIRNIGWNPDVCAIKAKEALLCVKKNFPSVLPEELNATVSVADKIQAVTPQPPAHPPQQVRKVGRQRQST